MKPPRPAWLVTTAATTLTLVVGALTLFVFPPGQLDQERYVVVRDLMDDHLPTIDARLQDLEWGTGKAIPCPLEWHDEVRVDNQTYELSTNIVFASLDEVRGDWVPTCDGGAPHYAVTLEGDWTNAPAPAVFEFAAHRYYGMPVPPPEPEVESAPIVVEDHDAIWGRN